MMQSRRWNGVHSKAAVPSFSVIHCVTNLFLVLRLGTKDLYKKDRFALSVSKDSRLVFARDCKRFTDSFAVGNRYQLTSFSCVCCRVCYQTLEFYCAKMAKLLTSNLACVSMNISCVWLKSLIKIFRLAE